MTYLREFRLNWPNLLGAALGLGFGVALNHHMMNLFGPALLAEFGWSKAQFALVGMLGLVSLFFAPVAGRITDRLGPRRAAMIGFSVLPVAFLGYSLLSGPIWQFYAITLLNNTLGVLTATMVFTRVVVERFDRARGLALSFLLSCPPLVVAVAAPIIGAVIEAEGWRTAYRVLAIASGLGGLAAIILVGPRVEARTGEPTVPKLDWAEFRGIARQPVFLLLMGGMFLCNVPQILVASQLNLLTIENGATATFATLLVSIYSICVVIGRFLSGYALDRVPPHIVAVVALGLPTIGYLALASSFDAIWLLTGAIALVGLAQGAETDVGAFLTSRKFSLGHFSFVFSMLMAAMGLASAIGSMLLSYTLHVTDRFDGFLYIAAGATLGGALFFYLTGPRSERTPEPA